MSRSRAAASDSSCAERRRESAEVLQKFYGDAKRGSPGRHSARPDRSRSAEQRMTRRFSRGGRTCAPHARQRQYIQNILEYDITFAIGPAGTGKTYLAWRAPWTRSSATR